MHPWEDILEAPRGSMHKTHSHQTPRTMHCPAGPGVHKGTEIRQTQLGRGKVLCQVTTIQFLWLSSSVCLKCWNCT